MIIDWTSGAIQQLPTGLGQNVWTWTGEAGAPAVETGAVDGSVSVVASVGGRLSVKPSVGGDVSVVASVLGRVEVKP